VCEAVKEELTGFLGFKKCQAVPVVTADIKLLKYTPGRHMKVIFSFVFWLLFFCKKG
jgi:hypothetical protein